MRAYPATLRGRLVLFGVGIALGTAIATAVGVQRLTRSDIETALRSDIDLEVEIRNQVSAHAINFGSWRGIESTVDDLAEIYDERIAVISSEGVTLADSADDEDPVPALPPERFVIDIDPLSVAAPPLDQEAENELVARCSREIGIEVETITEAGVRVVVPGEEIPASGARAFDQCISDGWEAEIAESVGPVQLLIGVGQDGGTSVLDSERSTTFWLLVGAIVLAAAALSVLVAQHITRPLRTLTTTARTMADGDLSVRSDVSSSTELTQLGTAFDDMATAIEAQDAARRTLTSDVSHELRSPLTNLRGYLEGIDDGIVEPDTATITSLREEVHLLQTLVDDLQQLSLAHVGRLPLFTAPVDLVEVADRAVTAHQATARAHDVTIERHGTPDLVVTGDSDRLRQVIGNLVSNAIRHADSGTVVDVTIERRDDTAVVTVTDHGHGIDVEHLPHIFDRFYRADPSRTRSTGGTGLGLAISRELIRAHGGDIGVESSLGRGSTFAIELPIQSQFVD